MRIYGDNRGFQINHPCTAVFLQIFQTTVLRGWQDIFDANVIKVSLDAIVQ